MCPCYARYAPCRRSATVGPADRMPSSPGRTTSPVRPVISRTWRTLGMGWLTTNRPPRSAVRRHQYASVLTPDESMNVTPRRSTSRHPEGCASNASAMASWNRSTLDMSISPAKVTRVRSGVRVSAVTASSAEGVGSGSGMTTRTLQWYGRGMAYGGYLFLLADAAFSYACTSHGPVTVAHSAQVTFLQPAAVGDELRAEAVERGRYGRNGIYDVTIRRDDTVIAEFRGHSIVVGGSPVA